MELMFYQWYIATRAARHNTTSAGNVMSQLLAKITSLPQVDDDLNPVMLKRRHAKLALDCSPFFASVGTKIEKSM